MAGTDKITRMLMLFYRLSRGEYINKSTFAIENSISERSFERDVEDIRNFLSEIYAGNELVFDKERNAYYLTGYYEIELSGIEILPFLKILMSSRAFRKDEMFGAISAVIKLIPVIKREAISQLLCSEMEHYISPKHNKAILKIHWDLEQCILKQQTIKLKYHKVTGQQVQRLVSPVAIVFSEHYFYLIAFLEDKKYDYPAFFRIDRIESFKVTDKKYPEELLQEYNVGNMKNCIQFMYAGELIEVKLKCLERALEAVLDRLPNAKVIGEVDQYTIVIAKVFGDGFVRWVLSQGSAVEVLEPRDFREKIKQEAISTSKLYSDEGC